MRDHTCLPSISRPNSDFSTVMERDNWPETGRKLKLARLPRRAELCSEIEIAVRSPTNDVLRQIPTPWQRICSSHSLTSPISGHTFPNCRAQNQTVLCVLRVVHSGTPPGLWISMSGTATQLGLFGYYSEILIPERTLRSAIGRR
jgi:hypothetical protein